MITHPTSQLESFARQSYRNPYRQNTPFLSVLVIVGSLFGCADSQQVVRFGNAVEPVRMAAGDSIYIAVP